MKKPGSVLGALLFVIIVAGLAYISKNTIRVRSAWVDTFKPEPSAVTTSTWVHIPFGILVGWFPLRFQDDPVWVSIPYQKGPPERFIGKTIFHWKANEITLSVDGPLTLDKSMGDANWKNCFSSWFECTEQKKNFIDHILQGSLEGMSPDISWIQNRDPNLGSGIRVHWKRNKIAYDRVAWVSPTGTLSVMTFSRPIDLQELADPQFEQLLGSIEVRDLRSLSQAKAEIGYLLQTINLSSIQSIKDPEQRWLALSKAQVLLASSLSVQPNQPDGFFHFGGIAHLLGSQLLQVKSRVFPSQDSWSNYSEPNLTAMAEYLADFPKGESSREYKNLEELVKDLSYQRQKLLRR